MKIRTKLFNEQQIRQFSSLNKDIQKLQDKIASGKNFVVASDDPVGSVNLSGYKTVKQQLDLYLKNVNSEKSRLSLFKDGFLVAGTSPKAWAFFPLIFPQFINFESNYVIQFLILITTYVVLDFLSLICYAILANKLIDWLKANPKTINTISACVLLFIGIFIALTQQY